MFSFLSFLIPVLSAQPLEQRQARFQLCLQTNEFLQKQLQVARDQYLEVLTQTRQSVDRLIASYEVRLLGDALQLDDLRATVELSMQLRDLDEACDA
ncbi:MAG: hypothetical protein RLZZ256_207, partial [Bacteroidota bacterium]